MCERKSEGWQSQPDGSTSSTVLTCLQGTLRLEAARGPYPSPSAPRQSTVERIIDHKPIPCQTHLPGPPGQCNVAGTQCIVAAPAALLQLQGWGTAGVRRIGKQSSWARQGDTLSCDQMWWEHHICCHPTKCCVAMVVTIASVLPVSGCSMSGRLDSLPSCAALPYQVLQRRTACCTARLAPNLKKPQLMP